jgi:hypothetical protein
MRDYYAEDFIRLNKQPKRTIGDYVESEGILVPRRFDSLKEARAAKVKIICRSEHPQEYSGVSGLLNSPELSVYPEAGTEEELKRMIFQKGEESAESVDEETKIKIYSGLQGINISEMLGEMSLSFWEKVDGPVRYVVADSSVEGLYHIYSDGGKVKNYSQWYKGKVASESDLLVNHQLPPEFADLTALVNLYEQIRNLSHFDSKHCPIMEFVSSQNKNYFVQYHRARDFQQPSFSLDRKPEAEEVEAVAVRGCTPAEGYSVKTVIVYADNALGKKYSAWRLPSEEKSSFDLHLNFMFSEMMVRKRKCQFNACSNSFWKLSASSAGHYFISKTFKPEISLFVNMHALIPESEEQRLTKQAEETGENQFLDLQVISDGKKAYVRRM